MKKIEIYSTKKNLIIQLSSMLKSAAENKNPLHVSLSGGSTPKAWFTYLAQNHPEDIKWENIHFWWGDDRMVPPEDPESNYGEAKKLLFDHISIPSRNIHRVKGELRPEAAKQDYEREILQYVPIFNALPQFDLMILGMGDDGHTASIFPHNMDDLLYTSTICEVATHPTSGQKRITKTGQVLNNSSKIIFLVTGKGKAEKIREIHKEGFSQKTYPAGEIEATNGQTIWMIDQDAANLL